MALLSSNLILKTLYTAQISVDLHLFALIQHSIATFRYLIFISYLKEIQPSEKRSWKKLTF